MLGCTACQDRHHTEDQILEDFPELTREDINACFAFAADRERKLFVAPA
jgi:uncharacterized protein (DUF433 family)